MPYLFTPSMDTRSILWNSLNLNPPDMVESFGGDYGFDNINFDAPPTDGLTADELQDIIDSGAYDSWDGTTPISDLILMRPTLREK